jgi:rhodanese-related sulfurtransferase
MKEILEKAGSPSRCQSQTKHLSYHIILRAFGLSFISNYQVVMSFGEKEDKIVRSRVLVSSLLILVILLTMILACTPTQSSSTHTETSSTSVVTSTTTVSTTPTTTVSTTEEVLFPEVPRMTVQELKKLIDKKDPSLIVLDTRDPSGYDSGHIPGAGNTFLDPFMNPIDRDMMLEIMPQDRIIVLYCACEGEEISGQGVLYFWDLRYDKAKVFALKGGITEWLILGYPIETS